MLQDRTSKFQFYSIGIVVNDKTRNSDFADITPVEEITNVDKKISDFLIENNVSMPNIKGVTKTTSATGSAIIKARWLPLGQSNRISSPDLIKNETVILIRFADTDEYYWTTIFREPKIRRLETVLYAFGNLAKGLVEWTKKSSYWFEVSTHDKYVHLKTTKSNNEAHEYDIKIDTANSTVEIFDELNNKFSLNSIDRTIEISQSEGHSVKVTPDTIELKDKSGNSVILSTGSSTLTINVNSSVIVNASNSVKLNTPVLDLSGNLVVGGGITMKGGGGAGASFTGSGSFSGSMDVQGTISSPNRVNAPD